MSSNLPTRPRRLTRPSHDRVVAGVAQGLASYLQVPVVWVRVLLVVSTLLMQGVGIVGYIIGWALIPQDDAELKSVSSQLRTGATRGRPASADSARHTLGRLSGGDERRRSLLIGVTLMTAGVMLVIGTFTSDLRLSFVLPVVAVATGATLGLIQLDRSERDRWLDTGLGSKLGWLRVVGGLLLVVAGVVILLAPRLGPQALATVVLAVLVLLAGLAIVLAPWGRRLIRDLQNERSERVRQEERAEIAAHLHDSVLQTLALIQRQAADSDQVAKLARAQERQLREYLYGAGSAGDEPSAPATTVTAQVKQICAELEDSHGVPIEVVTVGDLPVEPNNQPLLLALREATLNAVRHGGTGVSVYVECLGGTIEAFVRDRGAGFDLETVPTDRLGVRESVVGRMTRAGGSATVRRAPGGGTEVALRWSP